MLVIENCNSLSDLRQKIIDGEEVRTARYEPCEDAISRQAVLDITWEEPSYTDALNVLTEVRDKVKELPSVNPTKTGHWIFQKIKYGEHLAPMRMWCSNCNSAFDLCCNQIKRYDEATKKEYLWGHCPWCGAKMVDPQEGSE